jgi:uncharacterized protein (TIGR03437 family)
VHVRPERDQQIDIAAGTRVTASKGAKDFQPGDAMTLAERDEPYAIGLGQTTPYLATDRLPQGLAQVSGEVTIHFGPVARAPDSVVLIAPGLYLVRTTIPASLPLRLGGITLQIDVDGIYSPSNVALSIVDPATLN